jgi:hypothetical protein
MNSLRISSLFFSWLVDYLHPATFPHGLLIIFPRSLTSLTSTITSLVRITVKAHRIHLVDMVIGHVLREHMN